jgi:hypothetical protein
MNWIIVLQPYLALPLIIVNLAVIYWIQQHQSERPLGMSCSHLVLSVVFAWIAIFLGMTFFSYSILESVLLIFAANSFLIMLWVVWKLVYKTGWHYY